MATWTIQLAGPLRIEGPGGREVSIGSRKGRGLFALLVLHQGIAVSRSEIAGQLWPDKPIDKQLQSLRQAVKDVREAFAPVEVVESSRDSFRLALADWTCDAVECLLSGVDLDSPLLPEMTEPVFDRWRAEMSTQSPSGEWTQAARGALGLAFWMRVHEPGRVLDLLYLCRDLLPYMPPAEVEATVRIGTEAAPDHQRIGWGHIQLALSMLWQGKQREGIAQAKRALLLTDPNDDPFSWASAVFAAAMFLIFRGRFGKALSLLTSALAVAQEASNSRPAVDRLNHAIAHCHAYQGDLATALHLLSQLDDSILGQSDLALRNAHRAIYSLLAGRLEDAGHFLFRAKSDLTDEVDVRLISQIQVADAFLLLAQGQVDAARELLIELHSLMEEYGIPLVEIHALETLALATDPGDERQSYWREALQLREKHSLPLLPLDRQRLRALLSP